MKILVIGLYYSNNLGDAVLCDCTVARLREHFPDAQIEIRDFFNRSAFREPTENSLERLEKNRRRTLLRRLATQYTPWDKQMKHEKNQLAGADVDRACDGDYDIVVFGGGQVFMDYLALFAGAFVERFSRRGTPIIFHACGTGPAFSRKLRRALSDALLDPNVRHISCRDGAGLVSRRYLYGRKAVEDVSDPALWCSEVYGVERDPNADAVGLGVMFANSVSPGKAVSFWVKLIREMEKRQIPWKYFVNGSGDDISFARYVHSQMPELNRSFEDCFVPVPRTPEALVRTISGFRSLISFRLHSHIIAASLGIPTVAMVWDKKLNAFFDKNGHAERCFTVNASPLEVLSGLAAAERDGWNRELLNRQREAGDQSLYRSVCRALKEGNENAI